MPLVPPTSARQRRSPFGAAAAAALGLVVAACSSGGSDASVVSASAGTTILVTAPPRTVAATTVATPAATTAAAPSSTVPATAGPPAPDPGAMLANAVAALRGGYDVDSNVSAGERTTNLAGRVVGSNSLFALTSGDATVEYLQVPPQTWVREPGGEWNEATAEAAPREALTPLGSPTNVALVSIAGDGTHLKVSYDGATLGSETPVEADMVLELNGGITVTYLATTQGRQLAVITRLAPASNPTPIGPPE